MNTNDIILYAEGAFGYAGDDFYSVASGTTASISPGEPVTKALGNSTGNVVSQMATNKPVVGTDYLAGISSSFSTETASAAGSVYVQKYAPTTTFLVAPKVAATYGQGSTQVQATYDALVGARVLMDLTSNAFTILAADSANNGWVVMPLDIAKFPGKVRVALRMGASFLA